MKTRATLDSPVIEALELPELETQLDGQHPWPGLEGYEEGDQEFFKGRSEEVEELYRLIRRERLTLLFGKAGTGKTSLVRAGLFPKQRREEALPVHVRLDYSEEAAPLGAQVKSAIYKAARVADLEAPEPSEDQTLWEYLHHHKGEFWSQHHRIIMPFIVFDQFEELFTHGLVEGNSERELGVRAFISELSDLAEDRVPVGLLADKGRAGRCNLTRHHYKLVVCVREEYLAELDRMRDDLPPALFRNRMRLTDMSREQAKEVVEQTGGSVGADVLADEIVGRASEDTREQRRETEMGVPKSSVNPALLAVLCKTLNQQRIEDGASSITRTYLKEVGSSILTHFYEKQLASLPPIPGDGNWGVGRSRSQEVNDRIAREFMDGDVRVSVPDSHARAVLGDEALSKLVTDGVLGYNEHGRVELRHDVLPETVRTSNTRFLHRTIRDVTRLAGSVVGAAALGAGMFLIWLFFNDAPDPQPPLPDDVIFDPYPAPIPDPPTDPVTAIALTDTIVLDLNEGTRRILATVGLMGTEGAFGQAGEELDKLAAFLTARQDRFCRQAPPATWRREHVNLVLNHACSAFEAQRQQWTTLDGLYRQGEEALVSAEARNQVVGAWEVVEPRFNERRSAINQILEYWKTEFGSGS